MFDIAKIYGSLQKNETILLQLHPEVVPCTLTTALQSVPIAIMLLVTPSVTLIGSFTIHKINEPLIFIRVIKWILSLGLFSFSVLFYLIGIVLIVLPFFIFFKTKNTVYYISNKRVIIISDFIKQTIRYTELKDIINTKLKTNFIDKIFKTGTIILYKKGSTNKSTYLRNTITLGSLKEPLDAYYRVQAIIKDALDQNYA